MKKSKKAIASILVFTMFLLIMASLTFAENTENLYTERDKQDFDTITALMRALDILDSDREIKMDETVSRGEFVELIVRFVNGGSSEGATAEHYAEQATQKGILVGYSDGQYKLDQDITFEEAVKCTVIGLGYSVMMDEYPDDYINTAQTIGILKGLETQQGIYLTWFRIMKLLYNALDAKVLVQVFNGDQISYILDNERTILSEVFHLKEIKGVVTSTEETPLFNQSCMAPGYVMVDETIYETEMDCRQYLGKRMVCYVSTEENRLVFMGWDYVNNDTLLLLDTQLESFANKTYMYTNEKGTTCKAQMEDTFNLIYNGYTASAYDEETMLPQLGEVTLIDSDQNGKYDTAIIWNYKIRIVQSVDESAGKIYLSNAAAINIETYEQQKIVVQGGRDLKLSELANKDVVYMAETAKKERLYVGVLRNKVSGNIAQIASRDEGIKEFTIDGEVYTTVKPWYREKEPTVGEYCTFIIDSHGRIAAIIDASVSGNVFGYLIKAYENDDDMTLGFKILTQEGVINKFNGVERIKVDGVKRADKQEVLEALCKKEKSVQPQLIKYELNEEGLIQRIDTAYNFYYEGHGEDYYTTKPDSRDASSFRVLYSYRLQQEGAQKYWSASQMFANRFAVKNDTIVFQVPENVATADDSDYMVATVGTSGFVNESAYAIEAYTDQTNNAVATALVTFNSGISTTIDYIGLVMDMEHTIDEEDCPVTNMYIVGPGGVYMDCKNYDIEKVGSRDGSNPGKLYTINKGDIISCQISNGKLVSASMVYDYETNTYIPCDSGKAFGSPHYYEMLYVYENNDGYLALTSKDPVLEGENITKKDLQYYNVNGYRRAMVEKGRNGVNVISDNAPLAEIPSYKNAYGESSRIFVYNSYGWPWLMIYYK